MRAASRRPRADPTASCCHPGSEQRGLAFATFALADDLGKGFGPVVIAALVARVGRERAFAYSMLAWLPCAALCAATALTVEADEARARRALAPMKSHALLV